MTFGDKLESLFPEFIALLPNIRKQHELLHACAAQPALDNHIRECAESMHFSHLMLTLCRVLAPCRACRQLLTAADEPSHHESHKAADFPVLEPLVMQAMHVDIYGIYSHRRFHRAVKKKQKKAAAAAPTAWGAK